MQDFETGTKGSFIGETESFAKRKVTETFSSGDMFFAAGVGLSFAGRVPFSPRFEMLHLSGAFRLE